MKDTTVKTSLWENLKSGFTKNFILEDRWKMVLSGIGVTLLISVFSVFWGSILGFILCAMKKSHLTFFQILAKIYSKIMQGTPIVVFLMILYYVIFKSSRIDAIWVAVIGFSLNFGATASEIFKSGIDAIDPGQAEAAYAMGAGKVITFTKVILPQAVKNFFPVFKGSFVALVKSTSIVGYIAIEDLTKVSDMIRSRTYDAFFPLIVTAIIYFLLANILILILNIVEKKFRKEPRI